MTTLTITRAPSQLAMLREHRRPERYGRLHLTRRGRLVLLGLALVAVAVVFSIGRVSASAAPVHPTSPASGTHLVLVRPGDTLWGLVRSASPGADPRQAVVALATLNGVDADAPLRAGTRLRVPGP